MGLWGVSVCMGRGSHKSIGMWSKLNWIGRIISLNSCSLLTQKEKEKETTAGSTTMSACSLNGKFRTAKLWVFFSLRSSMEKHPHRVPIDHFSSYRIRSHQIMHRNEACVHYHQKDVLISWKTLQLQTSVVVVPLFYRVNKGDLSLTHHGGIYDTHKEVPHVGINPMQGPARIHCPTSRSPHWMAPHPGYISATAQ